MPAGRVATKLFANFCSAFSFDPAAPDGQEQKQRDSGRKLCKQVLLTYGQNLQPGQHWPKHSYFFFLFSFSFFLLPTWPGCISFYFNTSSGARVRLGPTLSIINNTKMKRIQPQSSIQITTQ